MIEVALALSGLGAGIAAVLPRATDLTGPLKPYVLQFGLAVSILATILAICSAYSALWLLAQHCIQRKTIPGFIEIGLLILRPTLGTHWLIAICLLIWSILAFVISISSVLSMSPIWK
jgi:hypothetical protein